MIPVTPQWIETFSMVRVRASVCVALRKECVD